VCAGILRIGIGLDRTHAGVVEGLWVSRHKTSEGKILMIDLVAAPDADLSLEVYTANERKDLLEMVLETPIEIVVGEPDESGDAGGESGETREVDESQSQPTA
jgi:hypothetical protein